MVRSAHTATDNPERTQQETISSIRVISDSDAPSGAPLADTGPGLRVVWTGATGVGECVVTVRD